MIRTSLAAIPRRVNLLTAKATILSGLTVPVGLVAAAGCLIAGRLLLPHAGLNPAHGTRSYRSAMPRPCAPQPTPSSISS